MDITAIVLSRQPISRKFAAKIPAGVTLLNFVSDIKSFKSYQRSWFMAISQVTSGWFFFLDDDDKLPDNFLDVVERAITAATEKKAALVYTNELITNDSGISVVSRKEPYSQEVHIKNPMLCHHLVIGRTEAAVRAMNVVPRGDFMPEPLLYFQMAKEGALWVDEIGYHWHRGAGGMHMWPSALAAQGASMRWCRTSVLDVAPTPPPEPSPIQLNVKAQKTGRKTKEH